MPRHRGWGSAIKSIAESTQLTTEDVKGVLAAAHAIAYAEVKKGREVVIPQFTPLKLTPPPPPPLPAWGWLNYESTLSDGTL